MVNSKVGGIIISQTNKRKKILKSTKTEVDGTPITYNGDPIPDAVNTFVFTIVQHFISQPNSFQI